MDPFRWPDRYHDMMTGMTHHANEYKASRCSPLTTTIFFLFLNARNMTDLTSLDSPSTLYLPLAKETGLPRRFNRRSTLPFVSTPTVTVQMVDTDPPPLSPVRVRDESLLSPPPHTFKSRGPRSRRLSSARPVPLSAPPKLSPENTSSIRSPDYSSLHPKSPESPPSPNRRGSTLTIVRPATTLCAYPLPIAKSVVVNSAPSPSEAILEEYLPFSCHWDILRVFSAPHPSFYFHRRRTSLR